MKNALEVDGMATQKERLIEAELLLFKAGGVLAKLISEDAQSNAGPFLEINVRQTHDAIETFLKGSKNLTTVGSLLKKKKDFVPEFVRKAMKRAVEDFKG